MNNISKSCALIIGEHHQLVPTVTWGDFDLGTVNSVSICMSTVVVRARIDVRLLVSKLS